MVITSTQSMNLPSAVLEVPMQLICTNLHCNPPSKRIRDLDIRHRKQKAHTVPAIIARPERSHRGGDVRLNSHVAVLVIVGFAKATRDNVTEFEPN